LALLDWSAFWSSLLAIAIWGSPVEGAIIWLVWKTRKSVGRAYALSNLMPVLTPHEEEVLNWTVRRAIDNEVQLYEKYIETKRRT
jgi:hypothetical protein